MGSSLYLTAPHYRMADRVVSMRRKLQDLRDRWCVPEVHYPVERKNPRHAPSFPKTLSVTSLP
jgi:hypothetical protein